MLLNWVYRLEDGQLEAKLDQQLSRACSAGTDSCLLCLPHPRPQLSTLSRLQALVSCLPAAA